MGIWEINVQSMVILCEEMCKDICPNMKLKHIFLKILTTEHVTKEAGSLFQYSTTLIEEATSGDSSYFGVPCRGGR